MAKYSYRYKCGHGNGTVSLYGKYSERERKLAWYADTFVCPDCYKQQQAEADAKADKTAKVQIAVMDRVYLSIQVSGQLAANTEALYKVGFRWQDELGGGLLAFLKAPKRVRSKWAAPQNMQELKDIALAWQDELATLGYKITEHPSTFDLNAAVLWFKHRDQKAAEAQKQEEEAQKRREAAAKAEAAKWECVKKIDPKPNPPKWYRDISESKKFWNGNFYGNDKRGWCIYLDGQKTAVDRQTKDRYERWVRDLQEWRKFWSD